jgi:aconitase A
MRLHCTGDGDVGDADLVAVLDPVLRSERLRGAAIVFAGDYVYAMSIDTRVALSAAAAARGAVAAVFPFDQLLRHYLLQRADAFDHGERPGRRSMHSLGWFAPRHVEQWFQDRLEPDPYARYAFVLEADVTELSAAHAASEPAPI